MFSVSCNPEVVTNTEVLLLWPQTTIAVLPALLWAYGICHSPKHVMYPVTPSRPSAGEGPTIPLLHVAQLVKVQFKCQFLCRALPNSSQGEFFFAPVQYRTIIWLDHSDSFVYLSHPLDY